MVDFNRSTTPAVMSILAAAAMSLSGLAQAHGTHEISANWEFNLGVGLLAAPNYTGDDAYQLIMAPSLGRDADGDSPLRILGDGTDDLIGLGDTESAVSLRLFTQYKVGAWSLDANLQQTFTD